MGFIRKIGSALKGEETPAKAYKKAKDLEFKQQLYERREKGYKEQKLKNAEAEGRRSAKGGGGVGGFVTSLQGSIGNTEKAFGFNNIGSIGTGLDFGLGLGPEKKPAQPTRTTRITRSGTVIVTETGGNIGKPQAARKKPEKLGFQNVHNFFDEFE